MIILSICIMTKHLVALNMEILETKLQNCKILEKVEPTYSMLRTLFFAK